MNNSLQGFALHRMVFDEQNNPVDYIFLDCNQAFEEQTGLKIERIIGERASEVIPGLKETGLIQKYGQAILTQESDQFKRYFSPLDSWYQISVLPLSKEKFITIFMDITEDNQSRKENQYHRDYKKLFASINSGVAVYEPINDGQDFRFIDLNKKGEEIDNLDKKEILNKKVTAVFPGIKEFGLFEVLQRVYKTGQPEEHPIKEYDDGRITGYRKNYVYKLPTGEIVAVYDDLTEQKEQERRLKETKKRLKLAIEGANLGLWDWNNKSGRVSFNARLADMLGYESNELEISIKSWKQLIHNDDKQRVLDKLNKHFKGFTTYYECEYRVKTKSGNWKWIKAAGKAVARDQEGTPTRTVGIFQDINERKRLEQKLKLNQFLVDKAPIGIFRHTPGGKFEYANQKACELLDYSREELLDKGIFDFDTNFSREEAREFWQDIESGEVINLESSLKTRLGTTFIAQIVARYLDYKDKDYVVAFIQDITEKKKSEHQLQEQFNKGKKIHRHLLPDKLPQFKGIKIADFYSPSGSIGADFYQVIELESKVILYVSDITGHSLDGAFLNLHLRGTIRNFLHHLDGELDLNKLIDYIHYRYQLEDLPDDYFVSLLLFTVDKQTREVEYINAGQHINPILVREETMIDLDLSGPPISNTIGSEFYDLKTKDFKLEEDSCLVISTDGLIEEESGEEIYGEARLRKLVADNYRLPPEILLDTIIRDLNEFTGQKSNLDDITLLVANNIETIDKLLITIPCDFEKMDYIKQQIRKFLVDYYSDVDQLLIGLQEIAINAIEHGSTEQHQCEVEFRVYVLEDSIVIEVEDDGPGFNWQSEVDKELSLTDFNERGRGIAIANKAFDRISYNQAGNKAILYNKR